MIDNDNVPSPEIYLKFQRVTDYLKSKQQVVSINKQLCILEDRFECYPDTKFLRNPHQEQGYLLDTTSKDRLYKQKERLEEKIDELGKLIAQDIKESKE